MHLYIVYSHFHNTEAEVSSSRQQHLKYLLSGPLYKRFTKLYFKIYYVKFLIWGLPDEYMLSLSLPRNLENQWKGQWDWKYAFVMN